MVYVVRHLMALYAVVGMELLVRIYGFQGSWDYTKKTKKPSKNQVICRYAG